MRAELENYLTKIPLYIVTAGTLSIIVAVAAGMSLFDEALPHPLAIIATSLVFGGISIAASYGLGRLYGIHSHLQSALITALILTLIYTPSLSIATLLAYAVVAVIAQASKFIVVWRGRHVFNPAALGACIGGVALGYFPSWWVGTPVLLPVAGLLAFLVLYKTRQLLLGAVFLGLALALLSIRGVAIVSVLGSWPIVFLAGYMLSEPATLPGRKWQKVIVASVVAVFVGLPFHIGPFYSSPELALLVGNAVAFGLAFRQRAGLKLKLVERQALSPTVDELAFVPSVPLTFEPGQYVELTVPHKGQDLRGIRRAFSLTNAPSTDRLTLGIKFYQPGSTYKQVLRSLPMGTVLQTTGITGDFVLPKDPKQKLLFIAGGIGITPFVSQIVSMAAHPRDIVLLYFVRNASELVYKELLDASGIVVSYFVADAEPDSQYDRRSLSEQVITERAADIDERIAYISGPPAMVEAAKRLLRGKAKGIKTDYFSGY